VHTKTELRKQDCKEPGTVPGRRPNRKPRIRFAASLFLFLSLCLTTPALAQTDSKTIDLKVHPAPDFGADGVWLDQGSPAPHHISGYHGRVLLIDFWEYTCINCIRDFGVVKRWYGKYHQYGLDVVGVHYGEFAIGFNVETVRAAAQRFRLPWPVVADQKGSTWKAFASDGWPNRYLVDPQGNIVMKVFGESGNRELESKIREELVAAHPELAQEITKIAPDPDENTFKPECGVTTQETFVGEIYGRSAVEDMAGHHTGDEADFQPPHSPPDGAVMLVGRWRVERDGVFSDGHGAAAELRYHARSLYAVLSLKNDSPKTDKPIRVNLFQDGSPLPKDSGGADVKFDAKGAFLDVTSSRMYYVVRSPAFSAHLISMQPEAPGLGLNSFTFGNNCQLADIP
jgi:thiol-disulfide isomerase/thioredoxin